VLGRYYKYVWAWLGHPSLIPSGYHHEWYPDWKPNYRFSLVWKPHVRINLKFKKQIDNEHLKLRHWFNKKTYDTGFDCSSSTTVLGSSWVHLVKHVVKQLSCTQCIHHTHEIERVLGSSWVHLVKHILFHVHDGCIGCKKVVPW
jgi:hypothetical protein